MSFDVGQFLLYLRSDGQIVKIKSDLAFASFDSHVVTASGGSFGFGIVPFTYFQESFLMSKASISIFQVSRFSRLCSSFFVFVVLTNSFKLLFRCRIRTISYFSAQWKRAGPITCRVYAVFENVFVDSKQIFISSFFVLYNFSINNVITNCSYSGNLKHTT
jgi:hypothetical protein